MESTIILPTRCEDETLALVEQLAEINRYQQNDKGKYRDDMTPDRHVATTLFQDEVTAMIDYFADLALAQSIAAAVDLDGPVIASLEEEEALASNDRRLAHTYDADYDTIENVGPQAHHHCEMGLQGNTSSAVSHLLWSDFDKHSGNIAGPSRTYAQQQEEEMRSLKATMQCCVCYDNFFPYRLTTLNCTHLYCKDCLVGLFMRSTKDQSLFPPRCCREPIALALVQENMSEQELSTFQSAELEFTTTDRIYCSNTSCGRFIPPNQITADQAYCTSCKSSTCTMCKNAFHQDDCAKDPALQATLALAESEGWQRCFSCRAVVQLHMGCYHMTCKCRAEFCYLCGTKWKTCSCIQFEERRLYDRAVEIVDRQMLDPWAVGDRQQRIVDMQEDLRENHECAHPGRFERIDYGARCFVCEMCGISHRKYILQCRRCHIQLCQTCRQNRI